GRSVPDALLRDAHPDPIRNLVPGVRRPLHHLFPGHLGAAARQNPRVELSATDSLILVGVIAAGVVLLATADIVRVPFPILLVLRGLALAPIPCLPPRQLHPPPPPPPHP